MNHPHVIVVGAGIGGLTAALDLVRRGIDVTVVERAPRPGGKMREIDVDGNAIDSGPTVFTMPWIFEELFADAGSDLHEHVELLPAELLARHGWTDGSKLDLFADEARSQDAIRELSGPAEADRYRRFCRRAKRTYETLYGSFMRRQRPSVFSLVAASGVGGLFDLWRIRPFRSLWRELGDHFHDPRLRGLFARYATYCGGSPLHSPATLMLVAHVEQRGVWRVQGGMQRLAEALEARVVQLGGNVRYGRAVERVEIDEAGRASGVVLEGDERLAADAVVANADVGGIARGLLGERVSGAAGAGMPGRRSLSAMTWSLVAETQGFEVAHHNVFFPDDYPREFVDIFEHGRLPEHPAVYVCAQGPAVDTDADSRIQRLFMIANAPARGDRQAFDEDAVARMESSVFGLLERCGLTVRRDAERRVVQTPGDFERRFPGTGGALYGMAPHGWRASFSRPGSRSRIPGLYLAGGSVHPGPGVPMTAISGRLAADAVMQDLGQR